ncbi:methyl-accepting chemotaxis protein [Fluviispira vulneris]|uniref:methyl-accepting chemotaxis protein n=1 Tax=Fluviispira vulneris TaxID=2763012 RepID=UPI001648EB26|nr:methyl-accepting chemotaxis protein [Fluviispira vulneris]
MLEKLSLRAKIFVLSIGGIIIVSIAAIILIFVNVSQQEEMVKSKLFLAAEDLSNSFQDQFYERYGDIKVFAQYFRNINGYSRDHVNTLNQFSKLYGIYDLILVCDLNGKLLAVNDSSPEGKKNNSEKLYAMNFSKAKWFKETLARNFLEDPKKGFSNVYFQDPNFNDLVEKVYQEKNYGTIFSAFIYNIKGEAVGIISNHANFFWLENTISRVYDSFANSGLKSLEINLLDSEGNIILDFHPATNGYKNIVVHDGKILNKFNLVKEKQIAAINAQKGQEGVLESENVRRKEFQFTAYKLVTGMKIADKLNWKVLVRVDKGEALSAINKTKIIFALLLIAVLLLAIAVSIYYSTGLSKVIMEFAAKLAHGNQELNRTSAEVNEESQKLSSASIQQTSALQETASAVNEISAMMNKTSEMANMSKRKSEENRKKITAGKSAIDKMVRSIGNIKTSNQNVLSEVFEGNKRISEIVKFISEIEDKAKLIDEIVFQTKILSFNASVEAARAGEHGRGFSIVAEEVGNLAQMSGNTSSEISALLENSVEKVRSIIDDTKNNVERIMLSSKEAVQSGEEVSRECMEIFEKIFANSEEVNSLINEISNSSIEQANGVAEINNAMSELDTLTNQNSKIAQKSSETSTILYNQSHELEALTKGLMDIVYGHNEKSSTIDINDAASSTKSSPKRTDNKKLSIEKFRKMTKSELLNKSKQSININEIKLGKNEKNLKDNRKKDGVPKYDDDRFEEL